MPDVLLVQPPIRDFYLTRKRTVPYGLISIAAELIRQNITVALLDALSTAKSRCKSTPSNMNYLDQLHGDLDYSPFALFNGYKHFGYSFSHIGTLVKTINPRIVGISSLFSAYSDDALEVAYEIKKNLPNVPIVMGGHHPTAFPEDVIRSSDVDFVLRGEGEISFPLLVKKILTNDVNSLHSIPGIVLKEKHDETIFVSKPSIMENLDSYPIPSVDLLNYKYYQRGNKRHITITASRGCPMRCSYCSIGGAAYLKHRKKKPETILKEIESYGPRHAIGLIDFEDEHLSWDRSWFMEVLDLLTIYFRGKEGDSDIELRAMNGLFPPSLDEELLQKMLIAGFKTLNLSIGTTDSRQVKLFLRPNVAASVDRVLSIAESLGMDAVGYIIAGGPFQTAESSVDDLVWLLSRRILAGISIYYPAPLSMDYEKLRSLNLLPNSFSLMRNTALPIAHKTSRVEAVTLLRLGRLLNFIKLLIDDDEGLPEPSLSEPFIDPSQSRKIIGRRLLSSYLYDGNIRGMRPDGSIFIHNTSFKISKFFLEKLKETELRGHKSQKIIESFKFRTALLF